MLCFAKVFALVIICASMTLCNSASIRYYSPTYQNTDELQNIIFFPGFRDSVRTSSTSESTFIRINSNANTKTVPNADYSRLKFIGATNNAIKKNKESKDKECFGLTLKECKDYKDSIEKEFKNAEKENFKNKNDEGLITKNGFIEQDIKIINSDCLTPEWDKTSSTDITTSGDDFAADYETVNMLQLPLCSDICMKNTSIVPIMSHCHMLAQLADIIGKDVCDEPNSDWLPTHRQNMARQFQNLLRISNNK